MEATLVHSIRAYLVAPAQALAFSTAVRDGGLWYQLARQLHPDWIGTDLLQSRTCPNVFIKIDFFFSEEAYTRGRRSPWCGVLERFLRNLTVSQFDLGLFTFPPKLYDCDPVTAPSRVHDLSAVD